MQLSAKLDALEKKYDTQFKTTLSVNLELILLYRRIRRDILRHQKEKGWGAKVIDRLAVDLRHAFPEVQGFSSRNLKYMRAFSEAYPDEQFVQQVAAQIPWFHNCLLLDKIKDTVRRDGISANHYKWVVPCILVHKSKLSLDTPVKRPQQLLLLPRFRLRNQTSLNRR